MTYHMPRVMYWIQHGTLAHYPTPILRQLHLAPGAEMLVLQFQVLSGGDRFANLVQWLAFAGATAGVSLLAEQLGAGPRGQLVAAAFVASLPMAALQSTNAQTDLTVGFWIVATASFLLWAMKRLEPAVGAAVLAAGAALGLAILTKTTAYLFALPLCVWFATTQLRRFGGRALPAGLAIAVIIVALNLGNGVRNAKLYGTPMGPTKEVFASGVHSYLNASITPGRVASNVIRNLSVQALTPSRAWGNAVVAGVTRAHEFLGLDVNDPATTWEGETFSLEPRLWAHADVAPAPLHLIVLLGVMATWLAWRKRVETNVSVMLICVVAAFLLFCVVIRWQPWHARLHLALWLLLAGPIGAALEAAPRILAATIAAAGLVFVWPALAFSNTHPWVGETSIFRQPRFEQYFSTRPQVAESYRRLKQVFAGQAARCVGLVADDDEYVYPLWVILHDNNSQVRIENLEVSNLSARLKPPDGVRCDPEIIVVLRAARGEMTVRPVSRHGRL